MDLLVTTMQEWSCGKLLEQRAAAAALCEPRLLIQSRYALAALEILDQITANVVQVKDRHSPDFLSLRKGLGYCWSVAVAALPTAGKRLMEKWLACTDKDIRWIMKENLKKNRLSRLDPEWVKSCLAK